jgi:hypothetical protein
LGDRAPHIGEYDAKTNAICDFPPIQGRPTKPGPDVNPSRVAVLLTVILEHFFARGAQLGTILLKASQNCKVALINHCAAVALDVARAGRLFLRRAALIRDGTGESR